MEVAINKTKEVIRYQQQLVDNFGSSIEKKSLYWFCKAYLIVTQQQLEYISNKRYQNPWFVANVIVEFNAVFQENLEAYLHNKPIPSNEWELVFQNLNILNGKKSVYNFLQSWKTLVSCVDVHIKKDLPLCLAAVINECHVGKVEIALLEKDFKMMTNIFHYTAKKIEAEIIFEYKLPLLHVPDYIRTFFLKKYIYHKVIRNREHSWKVSQVYLHQ